MKKTLLAILLAASMLVTLAACGGNEDTTTTTTKSTTKVTTTKKLTETTAPDDGGEDDPEVCDSYIPYGKAAIDGTKEAAWDNAAVFPLEYTKSGTGAAADGTAVTGYMLWDNDGFYFLFEITDADLSYEAALGDYRNDGIYLYISENASNEISAFASFVEGTYQFALINNDLSMLPRYGESTDDIGATAVYSTTPTGMIIEFSYKSCQATAPAAGQLMYLDFQYNDCSAGARLGALSWYNNSDNNTTPANWGWVRLLGEGQTAPAN